MSREVGKTQILCKVKETKGPNKTVVIEEGQGGRYSLIRLTPGNIQDYFIVQSSYFVIRVSITWKERKVMTFLKKRVTHWTGQIVVTHRLEFRRHYSTLFSLNYRD